MNRIYFPNLDALRTLACTMVIFEHTFGWYWRELETKSWFISRLVRFISYGEFGVFFFFMLSGFLITFLMIHERQVTSNFRIFNFYLRRALRIWPVYFFVLVLALSFSFFFPISFGLPEQPIENWWTYFLFLGNFDALQHSYQGIGVLANKAARISWSVAIEEQFYLIWPIIFILSKKAFRYVVFSIAIVCLIIKFIFRDDSFFYFHSISGFYFLALGAFSGIIAYKIQYVKKLNNTMPYMAFAYLALVSTMIFMPEIEIHLGNRFAGELIFSFCFLLILIDQTVSKCPLLQFSKIPFLAKIGRYTYGMYLYHQIIIYSFHSLFKWDMTRAWQPFIEGAIVFLLTLILSILSYRIFEQPFLKLKLKFSSISSGL